MIGRTGLIVCALTLLAVTAATGVLAQPVVTGTVVRIDQPAGVVVLDNGQMYQMTSQTVVLVNNQPTAIAAIVPGTPVVLRAAQPVAYRDGRYVVVTGPVASTPHEVSGVVRWVTSEPGKASLTLDDGRHIWIDETTQVLANGVPVMMSTLQPGTFVVVRSDRPLAFRHEDRTSLAPAAVVTSPSGTTVVTSPSAMPGAVYRSGQPYVMPGPIYPEIGLRERENERQSP
jgi:hypothetical protein